MQLCQLKDGSIHNVWSDNVDEKTLSIYALEKDFDVEVDVADTVNYSDVEKTGDDLAEFAVEVSEGPGLRD